MKFYLVFIVQIFKSLSFSRVWNYIRLAISFVFSAYFKIHRFRSLPAFISIEPTNICNLHCPECPTGNKSSIVPKGKMEFELCKKIIPQIKKHVIFTNLYFQGEPFVNDNMIDIIKLAHSERILTSISSNAHFITKDNADEIVKSGLTKIIISLDGHNQRTYEKYRRNGQFPKVIEGLAAIRDAKMKLHSSLPLVELQCLLFNHTEINTKKIQAIGKRYKVDIIKFKTAQFYDSQNIEMLPSDKNSRYDVDGNGELSIKKDLKNKCWKMWSSSIIAWNGNVVPCCFDKNHIFTFGNVQSQPFEEIWHSAKYQNFRKHIHTNRREIKMCQNCSE